ncbi:MAG: bifunctional adenosylcobinamide kinase/adenosylcobinamide-phosphate guanylyltransferase [Eubacteriaceae bacterium]|nr:bifunctional adenosylcobinamide kinase/adenosylcobinamide-phosphate guanylyltransferase [Eubacteriaceae bacterium]
MRFLLTGGSASGKSFFAERLAKSFPEPRYYIAAMEPANDFDRRRIAKHQEARQGDFATIERYVGIDRLILPKRGAALLECMCHLSANEMFSPQGAKEQALDALVASVGNLSAQCDNLIVVTNDVGSDGIAYSSLVDSYIGLLGEINRRMATEFDNVYEFCAGIPLVLKGERYRFGDGGGKSAMTLVIGAMGAGKKEYITGSLGYGEGSISDGSIGNKPVVVNLQEVLRGYNGDCMGLLPMLLEKEVVACNEVGSGVIPITKEEMVFRVECGRLCNALAQNAQKVVRVVCGIPVVIKG